MLVEPARTRLNRNGLAQSTTAPAFLLSRLDGGELSLDEYRGRRVLLVFSDPHCGPCNELAPRLQQLSRRTPDVNVVMVSRGDLEANLAKMKEHGLTFPIVLQQHWEISRLYEMFATPIAYHIDPDGLICGNVAIGVDAVLSLLKAAAISALLNDE